MFYFLALYTLVTEGGYVYPFLTFQDWITYVFIIVILPSATLFHASVAIFTQWIKNRYEWEIDWLPWDTAPIIVVPEDTIEDGEDDTETTLEPSSESPTDEFTLIDGVDSDFILPVAQERTEEEDVFVAEFKTEFEELLEACDSGCGLNLEKETRCGTVTIIGDEWSLRAC